MSKENLIFASTDQALQHLANLTGKKIKIAYDNYDNYGGESSSVYQEDEDYESDFEEYATKLDKILKDKKVTLEMVKNFIEKNTFTKKISIPLAGFKGREIRFPGEGDLGAAIEYYNKNEIMNKKDEIEAYLNETFKLQ